MKMDFEEVYKQNYQYVYGVCFSIFHQHEEAEDATQDVFVILIKKLDQFEGRSQLKTWLYRIAFNTCLMKLRRARYRREIPADWDQLETVLDEHEFQPESIVDVPKALGQLPPGRRKIMKLHVLAGVTHEEIAKLIHRTEGNSKSQYFRARNKMKELLEGY